MHKILTKTGQISEEHFRSTDGLPTSKRVTTCPYYLKEIFEFSPHCRIDRRNKLKSLFAIE